MTAQTYSKVLASNGESTIPLNFLIQGKRYRFVLKVQRFEKTVEKIDGMIHDKNASLKQITAAVADKLVEYSPADEHEAMVKQASTGGIQLSSKDKKQIVADAIKNNPGADLADLIKHITADGTMTAANARYLVTKALKK